ncbi:MAG: AtpZ/AtpI family protein [bacterium]
MSDQKPTSRKNPYIVAFSMLGELGLEIALPVVAFTMIGKRIDVAYGTTPKAIIISFILAFALSAGIIWKRADEMKKMYLE